MYSSIDVEDSIKLVMIVNLDCARECEIEQAHTRTEAENHPVYRRDNIYFIENLERLVEIHLCVFIHFKRNQRLQGPISTLIH